MRILSIIYGLMCGAFIACAIDEFSCGRIFGKVIVSSFFGACATILIIELIDYAKKKP